jgi:hypothetical protein
MALPAPRSSLRLMELDRVAAAGCAGLKLHPNSPDFDVADPAVTGVVARAAERGLPVLFGAHAPWDANQPGKFVQLAMAVPDARSFSRTHTQQPFHPRRQPARPHRTRASGSPARQHNRATRKMIVVPDACPVERQASDNLVPHRARGSTADLR